MRFLIGVAAAMGIALTACAGAGGPEPDAANVLADCPKPDDPNVLAVLADLNVFVTKSEFDAVHQILAEMPPSCIEHWQRKLRGNANPNSP